MAAPVQFSIRSQPKSTASAPLSSIFSAHTANGNGTQHPPAQSQVAAIPLPKLPKGVSESTPLLLRNANPNVMAAIGDDQKFRIDHASRPDIASFHDYERVPVSSFGYAMLAGMGWSKGTPIGLSNPQVVEPVMYIRRGDRLGLGADPVPAGLNVPSMTGKKRKKQGSHDAQLVDPNTGKIRHVKGIDEILLERGREISPGSRVQIVAGPHAPLIGTVSVIEGQVSQILLEHNQMTVRVEMADLSLSIEIATPPRSEPDRVNISSLQWVVPNILVRIVSKRHQWYNCKGRVYDIISMGQFTVLIDGALVQDLSEADVETVVADRPGLQLMCVAGPYKGHRCTLYRRMADRGKAKVDLDTGQRIKCSLDDISQIELGS